MLTRYSGASSPWVWEVYRVHWKPWLFVSPSSSERRRTDSRAVNSPVTLLLSLVWARTASRSMLWLVAVSVAPSASMLGTGWAKYLVVWSEVVCRAYRTPSSPAPMTRVCVSPVRLLLSNVSVVTT